MLSELLDVVDKLSTLFIGVVLVSFLRLFGSVFDLGDIFKWDNFDWDGEWGGVPVEIRRLPLI